MTFLQYVAERLMGPPARRTATYGESYWVCKFHHDTINERIPLGSNAPRLAELCRRWCPVVVAGDNDNLSETMLLETRRYSGIPTVTCLPLGGRNKLARSQAAIVRAERGLVYLPERDAPWVEVVCDQLAAFTGADGEADDIADAVSILGRLADAWVPGEIGAASTSPRLGSADTVCWSTTSAMVVTGTSRPAAVSMGSGTEGGSRR